MMNPARYERLHKRRRSTSPSSRHQKPRSDRYAHSARNNGDSDINRRPRQGHNTIRDQARLNALQEAEAVRQWVEQEDVFVLKQAKKKAEIRVKEGRAKPIDWLAVNLRVIDRERDLLDDEMADEELDVMDPESILEGLGQAELDELEAGLDTYINLETNKTNREFWTTMKVLCRDRRDGLKPNGDGSRAVSSVASDVDKLFSSKSLEELKKLEEQIAAKLESDEPIDVDYWSELLKSLRIWKAKASLKKVYSKVITNRLEILRMQQKVEAMTVRQKLEGILTAPGVTISYSEARSPPYSRSMDPEPLLKLRYEDKGLKCMSEREFLLEATKQRKQTLKMGFVPHKTRPQEKSSMHNKPSWVPLPDAATKPSSTNSNAYTNSSASTSRFTTVLNDDFSTATLALYERELARGISDNEEIFAGEEALPSSASNPPAWASKYRPRKPRYFNRVQMGYEWNKYNQTHYDHDNPPPKVVQGYKFNIFYPDLIDKTRAPTYRIEREGGRKRGQSFAPAGEDDTCLVRFIAGPPYEDIAFRIVDKEWDYSAKRERGFKSSFEKGILQLHFQLKKIYYRK